MNTATRIGLFGLGLVVAFTGALGAGRLVGPADQPPTDRPGAVHGTVEGQPEAGQDAATATTPGGLQVSEGGYRLVVDTPALAVGAPTPFQFRILGPNGVAVTRYTPTHEKELHLIVVRRDLSGFQHLHPSRAGDGTWSMPVTVAEPGQYRFFTDFQPAGRDTALTLGIDVPAPGNYQVRPLTAPARVAQVDGYTVELAGDLVPGTASRLTLRVLLAGQPVADLQPYLGAYGHLVALRDGDLAYLHVHPEGNVGDGRTPAGPDITFFAEVPSAGTYRLYLDFQHGGTVRTAEFTAVAVASATTPSAPTTAPSQPGAHDQPHGQG